MDINNIIVQHQAGSISYGTNLPTSDEDIRGIFCANEVNIRTPFFPIKEQTLEDEEDGKLYELTNYMKLYTDGNPNILETLWVDDRFILDSSEAYKVLTENRQKLLSKKVAFTYTGYAHSQKARLRSHNRYVGNPQPKDPPRQIDFVKLIHNFTNAKMFKIDMEKIQNGYRLIPYGDNLFGVYEAPGYRTYDHLFTLNTNTDKGDLSEFYTKTPSIMEKMYGFLTSDPDFGSRRLPLFVIKFHHDLYKKSKEEWKSYWSWRNNRNPARRELEEKYGFDTKFGMHLIRLLRMGEEILETGEVKVFREDAKELLDIRNGKYSYDEIMDLADGKDEHIRNVLYKKSDLPKSPDIKLASKVLMEVQDLMWDKKK